MTIGQTYLQLGLVDETEKILREGLKLNSQLYGEENKATASCKIYLGAILLNNAKYEEAEDLLSKAVETERRLSPTGSKDFALALDALGELYVRKGEFEKAKPLLQESVAMSYKINGENNADTAFTLISLGRSQIFLGDLVGAETTYRQSIAIYRQLPSRYEIRLATVLLNFGFLLIKKGNYDEGISTMREAENIFFQKQGDSYNSFEARCYLSNAYFLKGDYTQLIVEGKKAVDVGHKLKLEEVPDFLLILESLGIALTRTGTQEGEPYLSEAVKISPPSLPISGYLAKGFLGECLMAQRRFSEAEPLLQQSYEDLKTSQGENNPNTILAHNRLLKLYEEYKK